MDRADDGLPGSDKLKTITIVTPAFNESGCVDELARRLKTVFDHYRNHYAFNVIVVENGSQDDTYAKLLRIRKADRRFRILQLSRNFNFEGAVTAGLRFVDADAAIVMSADLQDPPEIIPEFIERWEAGYEIIYGVIRKRADENAFRRFATACFYWLINRMSGNTVPRNVSDFRLVDRNAYEALNAMPERNRMLRTMWSWVGFRSIGVEHDRPSRFAGTSSYAIWRFAEFGVRALLTISYLPLKVIPAAGLAMGAASFVMLIAYLGRAVWKGAPFDGFATIVTILLGLFGVLFVFLGVLSEYVGMIFEEVRSRPSFVVRRKHGFGEEAEPDPLSAPSFASRSGT
jgi:glycosyltransferase involved in cell wall biosynthesis